MGLFKHKKALNRSLGGDLVLNLFLVVFGSVMALPMVYAISNSLKPLDEFFIFPPKFFVSNPTLNNFSMLFRLFSNGSVPMSRYIFNTVFISVVGTAGQVILSSMAAYAIAKMNFPGKTLIFKSVVLALMFSSTVTGIANFIVIQKLGILDTYLAIIIPSFSSTLGLYLMKQFMEQMIPNTILEAAKIDGASEARIFIQIVMPMVKPAWLTLIIFSFQSLWNTGSSPYIFREDLKTINYALSQVLAGGVSRSGAAAAGAVLTMIVPIVMFVTTQSNIVETMATSGMKE